MTHPVSFPTSAVSPFFSLNIVHGKSKITLHMKVYSPYKRTDHYPRTQSLLEAHFPHVLCTECFNEQSLPFSQEVLNTEIGHLFEHVLLQYMCEETCELGAAQAEFEGRTWWKCEDDSVNEFDIVIYATQHYHVAFYRALHKSVLLLNMILQSPTATPSVPVVVPQPTALQTPLL